MTLLEKRHRLSCNTSVESSLRHNYRQFGPIPLHLPLLLENMVNVMKDYSELDLVVRLVDPFYGLGRSVPENKF